MRDAAYMASVEIARDKGPFPLPRRRQYLAAPRFASRLPEPIKAAIRAHGIRNSHLLSIAPTARSRWPSRTTRRTGSSRRSAGPTGAASACPTTR
jgi:ribonucleotide reductase alpha subunit